jgi:Fic family protein
VAGKKQKKFMIGQLAQMTANVLKNYPNKRARKALSDRILSLQEEIESKNGKPRDARAISKEIETSYENTKKHLDKLLSIGVIKKDAGSVLRLPKGSTPSGNL